MVKFLGKYRNLASASSKGSVRLALVKGLMLSAFHALPTESNGLSDRLSTPSIAARTKRFSPHQVAFWLDLRFSPHSKIGRWRNDRRHSLGVSLSHRQKRFAFMAVQAYASPLFTYDLAPIFIRGIRA